MSPLSEISVPHINIVAQVDKREEIYDYRCIFQPTQITAYPFQHSVELLSF